MSFPHLLTLAPEIQRKGLVHVRQEISRASTFPGYHRGKLHTQVSCSPLIRLGLAPGARYNQDSTTGPHIVRCWLM